MKLYIFVLFALSTSALADQHKHLSFETMIRSKDFSNQISSYYREHNDSVTIPKNKEHLKNKIKRKIKPLAWSTYDINKTIHLLYGQDIKLETSKKINLRLPEMVLHAQHYYLHLSTNLNVKSIAILQDIPNERSLVALYYPADDFADIKIPIKPLNNLWKYSPYTVKVVTVVQTNDNRFFVNKHSMHFNTCNNSYDDFHYEKTEPYIKTDASMFRYKWTTLTNGLSKLKFQIKHPMLSYRDAAILHRNVNFISYISSTINEVKKFDLYTSEYVARQPIINIGLKNIHPTDVLELSYTDIHGNSDYKDLEAKLVKKFK